MLDAEPSITPDEAVELYNEACDVEEASDPNERVNAFIEEITSHYPQIDDYPEDDVDDCPWSIAFDVTETSVIICISESRVEEVAPLFLFTKVA